MSSADHSDESRDELARQRTESAAKRAGAALIEAWLLYATDEQKDRVRRLFNQPQTEEPELPPAA